jgi:MerR family transcriptional regulator, heat shock protein HspR
VAKGRTMANGDDDRGVYIISVAAELLGIHPQTLRIYERKGLLNPSRTAGNSRRYSQADIDRLRTIQRLTQEGINLAGVKMIAEMEREIERLRQRMREMTVELDRMQRNDRAEIVPLRDMRRVKVRIMPDTPRRGPIAVGPGG